ncbi:MAG TPA: glycosyltransferase family 2 protein [Burkholderiales bacterium]|nr:glycosyltransferase family 2 protein [Burkholderiales bacterium]
MSVTPPVSIVVPAYNQAAYLDEAIGSVLAQTGPQVELIVLDDGSTDATRRVLEKYAGRFHWESQANMGQAATLNKGWAMASGGILGYLSADDYLRPDAVRRAFDTLAASPEAVLVYPDFEQVDEHSKTINVVRTPEFDYADMVLKAVCPPGPGAFFRRSAYAAAGGWNPELRRIPDFEFWLRLGLAGPFRRIPEVLACYRVHGASQSFSAVDEARADEIIGAIGAVLSNPKMPGNIRRRRAQAEANALLHAARLHLLSGRAANALARIAAAVRADPLAALRPPGYRLILGGLWWRLRGAGT